jgi:hypothetical protein
MGTCGRSGDGDIPTRTCVRTLDHRGGQESWMNSFLNRVHCPFHQMFPRPVSITYSDGDALIYFEMDCQTKGIEHAARLAWLFIGGGVYGYGTAKMGLCVMYASHAALCHCGLAPDPAHPQPVPPGSHPNPSRIWRTHQCCQLVPAQNRRS